MSKYKKVRIHRDLRQAVFERDSYTCRYCGSTKGPFHCDHIYPERHGGKAVMGNLATACKNCNMRKQDKIGIWPPNDLAAEQLKEAHRRIARKETAIRNQRSIISRIKNEQDQTIKKTSETIAQKDKVTRDQKRKRAEIADNMKLIFLLIGVGSSCGYMIALTYNLEISMLFVFLMWLDLCGWISLSVYTKLAEKLNGVHK